VRIGLLRHFPVERNLPQGWPTAAELQLWRESYDTSGTLVGKFDSGGVHWEACLSSDLSRAMITARSVFNGNVESTPLLREAEFDPFQTGSVRLPVWGWRWLLRFAWMTGHQSQRAKRDEFRQRVLAIADRLSGVERDTLVVSHAGVMAYLSAELRRRGFVGPKLRIAQHARAYIYERMNSETASEPKTVKPPGALAEIWRLIS